MEYSIQVKSRGEVYTVLVDEDDYWRVAERNMRVNITGQPRVQYAGISPRAARGMIAMHRWVIGAPSGMEVDHINGNGLDNRKCNLRLATRSGNRANTRKVLRRASSMFKGVTWNSCRRRWVAEVWAGRKHYLGGFDSEVEAARAYDAEARRRHGEYACLNFPEVGERSAITGKYRSE